jgi:protein TonB
VQPVEKKRPTPAPKTASESVQELTPNKLRYMPQTSATEEMVVPADQTVIEARPLYRTNPPPKYPAIARRRGVSGQVVLDVLVGESGSVVDLRLATSSGYDMLDDAAVAAVKDWVFEPGMRGNQKVEMWVRVPIRFELK